VLAGGTVLPVVHQLDHARPHTHGAADVLVFDASERPAERGPHGGLLLHPKSASAPRHSHHAPLSHGQGSVEHYAVAVALTAPLPLALEPVETSPARFTEPKSVQVETYLLSPLQPGAPPA